MDVLDSLEKRIDALTRMLGPVGDDSEAAGEASKPAIVDSLLSANSMLTEATQDRGHIKQTMDRASELDKYLAPNFLEEQQHVRSKEVYINAVGPDLHAQFEQLEQIKNLESTLGAEYFRNIPSECTDKLKQINRDNSEFAQQSELIEESLILAMKRYGEIQAGLLDSLNVMSKRLEVMEETIQQKKLKDLNAPLPDKEDK